MENFFDEYSPKWLDWYKRYIIVGFFLIAIGGFIAVCVGPIPYWPTDSSFLNLLIWLFAFACVDLNFLLCNMLLFGLLRNIHAIREAVAQNTSNIPTDELPDL